MVFGSQGCGDRRLGIMPVGARPCSAWPARVGRRGIWRPEDPFRKLRAQDDHAASEAWRKVWLHGLWIPLVSAI